MTLIISRTTYIMRNDRLIINPIHFQIDDQCETRIESFSRSHTRLNPYTSLAPNRRKAVLVQTCCRCLSKSHVKSMQDVPRVLSAIIPKIEPAFPIDSKLEEGGQSKY